MGRQQGHAAARVREALRRQLAEILQFEARDPRFAHVAVTRVQLSADLHYATVFVSVLGGEQQQQEALAALQRHKGFFRRGLAKRLPLRRVPQLAFRLDETPSTS